MEGGFKQACGEEGSDIFKTGFECGDVGHLCSLSSLHGHLL
jgi:hypothetical protein